MTSKLSFSVERPYMSQLQSDHDSWQDIVPVNLLVIYVFTLRRQPLCPSQTRPHSKRSQILKTSGSLRKVNCRPTQRQAPRYLSRKVGIRINMFEKDVACRAAWVAWVTCKVPLMLCVCRFFARGVIGFIFVALRVTERHAMVKSCAVSSRRSVCQWDRFSARIFRTKCIYISWVKFLTWISRLGLVRSSCAERERSRHGRVEKSIEMPKVANVLAHDVLFCRKCTHFFKQLIFVQPCSRVFVMAAWTEPAQV